MRKSFISVNARIKKSVSAILAGVLLTSCLAVPAAASQVSSDTGEVEEDVINSGIHFAESYQEVYKALKDAADDWPVCYKMADGIAEMTLEDSAVTSAAQTDTGAGGYSQTNLREAGVDEGDIVKTDGEYIYTIHDRGSFNIIKADGARVELVSSTKIGEKKEEDSVYAEEMYIDGNRLYIILEESGGSLEETGYFRRKNEISLYTYDISDKASPKLEGTVSQDGYYQQSRKAGKYIYLFSSYYPTVEETFEDSDIIPHVNGEELAAEAVCIPKKVYNSQYLIMTAINTDEPDSAADKKAMVSGAEDFYVSQSNIYTLGVEYNTLHAKTEIVKFHYEDGAITPVAAGILKGTVQNSFSLDEYEGNLRVLTTYTGSTTGAILEVIEDLFDVEYDSSDRWVTRNALYILDESLQKISRIGNIAKNETIRSARYFGDTAYFVTFENTDPLFSVDLSDPRKPKIIGDLKVSGFSSYLHPYGEDKLLGIGYEAEEENGMVTGLKLSMFDTSDKSNVKEIDRLVLDGITYCPSIENYKSILADPEKNIIGFYVDNHYMAFSYDQTTGFRRELLYDYYEDMLNGKTNYTEMRGLYIGNNLYLANGAYIIGFDMADEFKKLTVLNM